MVRKLVAAFALSAAVATGASAQSSQNFTFLTGGSGFAGYKGQFNSGTLAQTGEAVGASFEVWCVDPMEFVHNGDTYNVTVTPLNAGAANFGGTLDEVKQNTQWIDGNWLAHPHAASGTEAVGDYTMAAYLASQMNSGNQNLYEEAIWQVMGYTGFDGYDSYSVDHLINGITSTQLGTITLADWGVISDGLSKQEFLYHHPSVSVTPEPATMSLLAMGLVGMAGAGRRKRKQQQ